MYWLLAETFEENGFRDSSFLKTDSANKTLVEVGPRLTFSTAWSSNAISIVRDCGLSNITRMERSRRYLLHLSAPLTAEELTSFQKIVHDCMTECVYDVPLQTFNTGIEAKPSKDVPVMEEGRQALEKVN